MPIPEKLKPYAKMLGYPDSETLGQLLTILFNSEDKIRIAVALPGTIPELSEKTGFGIVKTEQIVKDLHMKGLINEKMDSQKKYRLYPGMIELRDASSLAPGIDKEVLRLWNVMIREEMPKKVAYLEEMGYPPMMRVIPIEETVESQSLVLDVDSARNIVQNAEQIVAIPCVCRMTARSLDRSPDCPGPDKDINLCLMINQFGNESIKRGIGEIISSKEAIRRLEIAEEAGLVHVTRNNVKKDMILCNCCSCCCTGMFMVNEANYASFAPSRFRIKLDEDACVACGTCEDRCQFHAIEVNDIAQINLEKCFGCGVCVSTCPSQALVLEEVRSKEHIRVT
ncbi:MAG: 4Fe-4S binding protein [Proteobacteria bacterium]|nr:4Fe-4S binding protein [Pseudomonadota bacterium]MBU1389761.1 4Fe-4S binding protein [Pseudomonadota bacterium]MBU1543770.1 4Fe-4S binding protein [Pseudomonadota bacterium]MBU2480125.1 4Fe-4S binding protein [Pseudomonadota bacterium]